MIDITLAKLKYREYKPTRVITKKGGVAGVKKSKSRSLRPRRRSWGPIWTPIEGLR